MVVKPALSVLKRIRIVLADDDAMFRTMCRDLVTPEPDLEIVAEVANADDVQTVVMFKSPDVLFLRLDMNGQRGFQVLERLYSARLNTHILAVCEFGRHEDCVRAVRFGCRGVLPRNTVPELILKSIRKVYEGELWLDRTTTAEVLRQLTLETPPSRGLERDPKSNPLSPREREIVALVTQGLKNRELADRLVISEQTVKNHMHNIFDKLGVSDRLELALYAVHHGLQENSLAARHK